MPSCAIRFCTNYGTKVSKNQGITYHKLPTNELQRIQWVDIVRKQRKEEGWQPTKYTRICSLHFKEEDKYTSVKGYTLLKKSAFPTFELPCTSQATPSSPNSLAEEKVSDLESILESPRTAALKKSVKKISFEKEKLINENRKLKKQNKRLQKRVTNLRDILKHLKKKNFISDEQLNELSLNEETKSLFDRIVIKEENYVIKEENYVIKEEN